MINKNGTVNKPWTNFERRLEQFSKLPLEQWTEYHFLGYLISKTYLTLIPVDRDVPKTEYTYKEGTSPSKHPELRLMRNIIRRLYACKDKRMPKDYDRSRILAYLDYCISKGGDKAYTLKYFESNKLFHGFKAMQAKQLANTHTVDRTTPLPPELKLLGATTYGDLAFMVQVPEYLNQLLPLLPTGFDIDTLRKVT